ncbi:hypothetical protein Gotri_012817 [Gossypium trilobum]|uniref:Uncharacterized protein n=1 Tax=Gossypium trilobum TaxID=34281 RepID=A0A7J9DRQ1_9ROSI|nr:hypothetical protein [Gossypium trilobum]
MVWDQVQLRSSSGNHPLVSGHPNRPIPKLMVCSILFVSLTYLLYTLKLLTTSAQQTFHHTPFTSYLRRSTSFTSAPLVLNQTAVTAPLHHGRRDVREKQKGHRSAIRISRIVTETLKMNMDNVRWFVMGDDDTVFITENLVRILRKYDHTQYYYIGSLSESHIQNIFFSYGMAYGGGGFAISYPLAKALAKMQDRCIQRYPGLYGSDDRMQACMAELGVPLTKELGFHQVALPHWAVKQRLMHNNFSVIRLGWVISSVHIFRLRRGRYSGTWLPRSFDCKKKDLQGTGGAKPHTNSPYIRGAHESVILSLKTLSDSKFIAYWFMHCNQYDVYGNLFGLLAAHPVTPLVSLHHLDVVELIFPNVSRVQALQRLMLPTNLDSAGIMQQSICYDKTKSWTISVSWGFAVQVFRGIFSPREIEMPSRTFLNWYKRADYTAYAFNTRPVSRNPCQKPFVFYMSSVRMDSELNKTVSEYERHHVPHPLCRWKMANPDELETVIVHKKPDPHLWDRSPRRNCCRVMESKDRRRMVIDVGVCKDGEVSEI